MSGASLKNVQIAMSEHTGAGADQQGVYLVRSLRCWRRGISVGGWVGGLCRRGWPRLLGDRLRNLCRTHRISHQLKQDSRTLSRHEAFWQADYCPSVAFAVTNCARFTEAAASVCTAAAECSSMLILGRTVELRSSPFSMSDACSRALFPCSRVLPGLRLPVVLVFFQSGPVASCIDGLKGK